MRLIALALFACLTCSAGFAAEPFSYICRQVSCVDIEAPDNAPSWCGKPALIELQSLQGYGARITYKTSDTGACDSDMSRTGSIQLLNDSYLMSFSDGDQLDFFSFKADSLSKVKSGSASHFEVVEFDGYRWFEEQDHYRFKKTFSCSSR